MCGIDVGLRILFDHGFVGTTLIENHAMSFKESWERRSRAAILEEMRSTLQTSADSATFFEVVSPDHSFTAYDTIHDGVPAGPARPEEQGDLGRLVMDLSAIGIPTTENTFALRVEGDSMSGAGINDGDILILERREPRSGDIVAALVDRRVTLKRYVLKENKPVLRAENPKHADIVPVEHLEIQGVAVGLIRRL